MTDKKTSTRNTAKKTAEPTSKNTPKTKVVKSKLTSSKEGENEEKANINKHFSLFSDMDIYLFKQGKHFKLYEKLGAHLVENNGVQGTYFAVWAPNGAAVSVIGDFNAWNPENGKMDPRLDGSGIWEIFIPNVGNGSLYKYMIRNAQTGFILEKFYQFACRIHAINRASICWFMGISNNWLFCTYITFW